MALSRLKRRFSEGLFRLDWTVVLMILVVGSMLGLLSVARYHAYNAGMQDLGNMAQSIWSATQGRPLEMSLAGRRITSRLAGHVEVFYFFLAPLYALFPSPETLLIVQAMLFAAGGLPLYRTAKRRLESLWAARLITACYLFYPVAHTAILFDFHADALAAPLLLFAIDAWDRKDWLWYAFWLALALSCKFYVSAAVMSLGAVMMLKGEKRAGFLTLAAGLGWGALAFLVIRPSVMSFYASSASVSAHSKSYIDYYFGDISAILEPGFLLSRFVMFVIVMAPALWLGLRSPLWLLPGLVMTLAALATSGEVYTYDYRFHHYALSVPFFAYAAVRGAQRLARKKLVVEVGMQLAITLIFTALLVDVPLNPMFWGDLPGWGMDPWAYGRTERDRLKDRLLEEWVPDDRPVSASFFLAPHLANRSFMMALQPESAEKVSDYLVRIEKTDWIVADALFDYNVPRGQTGDETKPGAAFFQRSPVGVGHPMPVANPNVLHDASAINYLLRHEDYALTSAEDGLLLFGRKGLVHTSPLTVGYRVLPIGQDESSIADFGDRIRLVDFDYKPISARRFLLQFDWTALKLMRNEPRYLAVTKLEGIEHARFVHLPTQILIPTTEWQLGVLIREEFEVVVPDDVPSGLYSLRLSWHNSNHLYAAWTEERSRIGQDVQAGYLDIDW